MKRVVRIERQAKRSDGRASTQGTVVTPEEIDSTVALILIEPRLRRIKGYRHLPEWRAALQAKIGKAERVEGTRVA